MPLIRPNGISTLIACQNEEVTVGWCILSFLDFSDEIIVVDNGSTDASKHICRELARRYAEKVQFYDVPHLKDLYENRQYAFERSRFRWIVRADADYICYTDGPQDCQKLRHFLLERPIWARPAIVRLLRPTVDGDFWHTARSKRSPARRSPRIYHWFPGFRFGRKGRWEGVRVGKLINRLIRLIDWPEPVWMHCNIKSSISYLFRSERTNWRELGDYYRFPTLESYLKTVLPQKYNTTDLNEVQELFLNRTILPQLEQYRPDEFYPYPALVRDAMQKDPVYRIHKTDTGSRWREYLGVRTIAGATWQIHSDRATECLS